MNDWRTRLRDIFTSREPGKPPEQPRPIADFIRGIVAPAFEALREELRQYGREAVIKVREGEASITVTYQGEEEFSYAVRGRTYRKMSFAFPEFSEDDEADQEFIAEVIVRGESQEERSLGQFSQAEVIADFLDEYAKWAGW